MITNTPAMIRFQFPRRPMGIAGVLILLFLLIARTEATADLGRPDLQALCRIELKDNTVVEGAVLAARGGYRQHWEVNGFYITADNNFKRPELFDLDFRTLEPWLGRKTNADGNVSTPNIAGSHPKVYYLEDITGRSQPRIEKRIDESTGKEQGSPAIILSRTITHAFVYRLQEAIPVYTEIPDPVYLDRETRDSLSESLQWKTIEPRMIPVTDIRKFDLVTKPSPTWLEAIEKKTIRLEKEIAKHEGWEYQLPVWFHEIAGNPSEYDREGFKPWDF